MLSLLLAAQILVTQVSFPSKDPGVTLTGTLYQPPGLTAPAPAVVVLHACDGIDDAAISWADWLAQNGYVALMVDSFGPRHVDRVCGTHDVPSSQRALDAYGGLAYLRTLPNVDGAHVGEIGFSHGGGTILWTENAGIAERTGFSQNGFAVAVALYPPCEPHAASSLLFPLTILIGGADNWTDARECQQWLARVDPNGTQGSIHVYPGVYHKFDDPSANKIALKRYILRYDPDASADAHQRVLAIFKQSL